MPNYTKINKGLIVSFLQTRPTPPHLTSVQAEQLLARACENEAENAKRMRMGLEPVSQAMPAPIFSTATTTDVMCDFGSGGGSNTTAVFTTAAIMAEKQLKTEYKSEQLASLLAATQQHHPEQVHLTGEGGATKTLTVSPAGGVNAFPTLNGISAAANGNGVSSAGPNALIFRPNFPRSPSTYPGTPMLLQQGQAALAQNGK
jgi:hypothetical protein